MCFAVEVPINVTGVLQRQYSAVQQIHLENVELMLPHVSRALVGVSIAKGVLAAGTGFVFGAHKTRFLVITVMILIIIIVPEGGGDGDRDGYSDGNGDSASYTLESVPTMLYQRYKYIC
jgi:hypothetical protein